MQTLRTPDERFGSLPDFPFEPHYVEVDDDEGGILRVHHLDENLPGVSDAGGEIVVLLHGEPSWCFLYRTMIPALIGAGFRCIVPDLVGFGRSDKPTERGDHTYERHVEWMRSALFDRLDLSGITLVCQDWGGLIGLRLVGEHPDRFARVVAANTGLPTGDHPMSEAFRAWQQYSQETAELHVGGVIKGGCRTDLSPDVIAAYDAPFPDDTYKVGPRTFPMLVPTAPDDPAAAANRAAWESLSRFDKPFLTAFSDGDPVTSGGERVFRTRVPGAAALSHVTISGGGHFLQEDRGPELARAVIDLVAATP